MTGISADRERARALGAFFVRYAWRPVVAALGISTVAVLATRSHEVPRGAASPADAVARVLTARGLACTADDVTWVVGPHGVSGAMLGGSRALVRAAPTGEPNDLFLVEARLSPEGRVIDVGDAWNLTRSSSADESRPLVRGSSFAYTTSAQSVVTGVHTIDLAGRSPLDKKDPDFDDWTRTQRWEQALTNLQKTGQLQGIVHDAYALDPPAQTITVTWKDDGKLSLRADDRDIVIDPATATATTGERFVRAIPDVKTRPADVAQWASERGREVSWLGDDRMQLIKAVVFTGFDWVHQKVAKDATAQDIQEELGQLNSGAATKAPSFTDPEIGWPPKDLTPLIKPALEGEGKWIALDNDPFVTQSPGAPAAFLTTFIRPNPKRLDLNVYVTLWDPRQIALHMEAGVVEPVSATGEHGTGLIPREPTVMKHVVAAFNGGFQAQHGEFGMQSNHILYLPPKPYAATVMEMSDGSTAFGTWPPSSRPDGLAQVPTDVLSYRQNLTALVEYDKFNPWQRTWWGGTPPGWGDNIHSARSALCLTKDNFVGYFYSPIISPDDLAAAELAAGCTYGVHLDMNPGHAGFEFYNVQPTAQMHPLGRPLSTNWEAEGKVPQMDGWSFRARRMIKAMGHMLFPRYIQREGRDFFYLTTRTVLPGAPLATGAPPAEQGEGAWRTTGLPQHGFPYAVATTYVRPEASRPNLRIDVLRADPRTLVPPGAPGTTSDTPTVLTFPGPPPAAPTARPGREARAPRRPGTTSAPPPQSVPLASGPPKAAPGESTLWLTGGEFVIAKEAPSPGAMALVTGMVVAQNGGAPVARAAVGIDDETGMLTWVELPEGSTPDATTSAALVALLEELGCSVRMVVTSGARALLGGALDLEGRPAQGVTATMTRLLRGQAPGAHLMFEDTPLVPATVWQPLQSAKVKMAPASAAP